MKQGSDFSALCYGQPNTLGKQRLRAVDPPAVPTCPPPVPIHCWGIMWSPVKLEVTLQHLTWALPNPRPLVPWRPLPDLATRGTAACGPGTHLACSPISVWLLVSSQVSVSFIDQLHARPQLNVCTQRLCPWTAADTSEQSVHLCGQLPWAARGELHGDPGDCSWSLRVLGQEGLPGAGMFPGAPWQP